MREDILAAESRKFFSFHFKYPFSLPISKKKKNTQNQLVCNPDQMKC